MFVKELWRYPIKSMAGERVRDTTLTFAGIPYDRTILVVGANGRVITSRTHYRLLGLKGTLADHGVPCISGHRWDSAAALKLVNEATGRGSRLILYDGVERFDVLPLLVATDGAIAHMGFDGRRLRPNIVIGGVEGLEERNWQRRRLRVGSAVIEAMKLRGRCIMTTYDPDTLRQDRSVLKRIVDELDGRMALDCAVVEQGLIREGDPVELLEHSYASSSSSDAIEQPGI
jgi:MOSC domain-containing protein